jgi:HEAT repeat protein
MNIKYIAAGVLILCLGPAVYYSMKESPKAESIPEEPNSEPILPEPQDAPAQEQTASGLAVSADEYEERRAASRIEAIDAMEKSNEAKTLTSLGNALADPNREVKEAALQALSERNGANITEMIRRGMADADPEFRIEVLEALAERGDSDSLRKAKSDPDEDVRERAVDLLESAGN